MGKRPTIKDWDVSFGFSDFTKKRIDEIGISPADLMSLPPDDLRRGDRINIVTAEGDELAFYVVERNWVMAGGEYKLIMIMGAVEFDQDLILAMEENKEMH